MPRREDGGELGELAQQWWLVWAETPQAAVFTDGDWLDLTRMVRLVDRRERMEPGPERLELLREILRLHDELGGTFPS